MSLRVIPLTLEEANKLVASWHRHHKPVQGHRFSIGALDQKGLLHGAAILGRPVARLTEQYNVIEVTRLVTDGYKNSCSFLYGASARIAKQMGFVIIQTFILDDETGISLRAAGWSFVAKSAGGSWNVPSRQGRRVDQPQGGKQKWCKTLNPELPTNLEDLNELL